MSLHHPGIQARLCSSLLTIALLLNSAFGGSGGGSVVATAPPTPSAVDPSAYLTVETGTLPVVLSAPHGGTTVLPEIPERTSGVTTLDTHTYELAAAIQIKLFALTGKQAHRVAALASRKFIDFNRSSDQAYESPAVAALYQAYHASVDKAVLSAKT